MWCTYNTGHGKKSLIWLYHKNQTRICQSLFWNMIHTYRNSGYQQCLHLHWLELLLWLNQVLLTLFFRNVALAGHTDKVLKFWQQILNLLEIWAQMIYGPSHVGSLWVNLILGLEHQNGCIKGYRPDMKIPSSDPESAHQIGPDDIWFMSFGRGNLTPSWCSYRSAMKILCPDSESPQKTSLDTSWTIPNGAGHISRFCAAITDLAILGATMGISNFPVQILNLLKKQVQIQVEPSQMEPVIFPDFS